jgi:hypothetical protein
MANEGKIWNEVHLGEANAPAHYRIAKFTNLIPIEVEFEENGEKRVVLGYMDYATQNIRFPDVKFDDEGMFREGLLAFMMNRNAKYAASYTIPDPPTINPVKAVNVTNKYVRDTNGENKHQYGNTGRQQEEQASVGSANPN